MNTKLVEVIEGCGLEVEDALPIIEAVKATMFEVETVQYATILLRSAIQAAEPFGLVRNEDGSMVTGAMASKLGVVLVR
ncbi:hypothetical protein D8T49_21405 [Vibrio vulnificus]|uniref:hypothetical protein n=1 Tax=Vibrio vulnificus TaxID=672 RepID=UPI001023160C|nr:hypothetical protein [Vibrio vulnificus]MCU8190181.1 hypothetical protein [Vibrio vulnificus]RZP97197.1 hypothetical protein D8T37_21115 [Vibrio vulnificus]RZQ44334.1 hypothetical protein D8T49_21405 [Vibrio vulnificus]